MRAARRSCRRPPPRSRSPPPRRPSSETRSWRRTASAGDGGTGRRPTRPGGPAAADSRGWCGRGRTGCSWCLLLFGSFAGRGLAVELDLLAPDGLGEVLLGGLDVLLEPDALARDDAGVNDGPLLHQDELLRAALGELERHGLLEHLARLDRHPLQADDLAAHGDGDRDLLGHHVLAQPDALGGTPLLVDLELLLGDHHLGGVLRGARGRRRAGRPGAIGWPQVVARDPAAQRVAAGEHGDQRPGARGVEGARDRGRDQYGGSPCEEERQLAPRSSARRVHPASWLERPPGMPEPARSGNSGERCVAMGGHPRDRTVAGGYRRAAMAEPLNPALRAVSDAVLAVAAQRSVEDVLQQLVDSARELAGARYAALGTPDGEGGFTRFLVAGMSDDLIASLGPLPHPRAARRDARDAGAVPDGGHPRPPALPRLVALEPSGHALLPRRADRRARGGDRRVLSDREDRGPARPVRRLRPGRDRAAGRTRGDRDRQRRALRAQPRALDAGGAQPARARAPRRGQPEALQPRPHRGGGRHAARPRPGRRPRARRAAARPGERGAGGAAHADPGAAPARAA